MPSDRNSKPDIPPPLSEARKRAVQVRPLRELSDEELEGLRELLDRALPVVRQDLHDTLFPVLTYVDGEQLQRDYERETS